MTDFPKPRELSQIVALDQHQKDKLVLVSGQTHPILAEQIAGHMGLQLAGIELRSHPNGESYVRFKESVRGKPVMAIQAHGKYNGSSFYDSFYEHLAILDAARLSKADVVTAICTNMAGARQDRQDKPRESVSAGLNLRMLSMAGASSLVTVDLHEPATLTAFNGPVDNLTAQTLLGEYMSKELGNTIQDCVVVSPDAGSSKSSKRLAKQLGVEVVYTTKSRATEDSGKITRPAVTEGVAGKICLVSDDIIDTAGTLQSLSLNLRSSGAKAILAAATHGWFSHPAFDRLKNSPIDRLFVADTLPLDTAKKELGDKLTVVSCSEMIARSLIQIVKDGSVSEIFNGENYS